MLGLCPSFVVVEQTLNFWHLVFLIIVNKQTS
jgi:hypothetical protein